MINIVKQFNLVGETDCLQLAHSGSNSLRLSMTAKAEERSFHAVSLTAFERSFLLCSRVNSHPTSCFEVRWRIGRWSMILLQQSAIRPQQTNDVALWTTRNIQDVARAKGNFRAWLMGQALIVWGHHWGHPWKSENVDQAPALFASNDSIAPITTKLQYLVAPRGQTNPWS